MDNRSKYHYRWRIVNEGLKMYAKLKNVAISGIVVCTGNKPIDVYNFFSTDVEAKKTISITGISSLKHVKDDITASDLGVRASEVLLDCQNLSKEELDAVIFVSQTPDYKIPMTSFIIQNKLGLSKHTYCLDIPVGCSGYIYGLYTSSLLINTGSCRKVLLISGDTISKLINKKHKSLISLFGDAVAATLIEYRKDGFISFMFESDGSKFDKIIVPAGGFRYPTCDKSKVVYTDEFGNSRTDEDLFMDGMDILQFAISSVPRLISKHLLKEQKAIQDINYFLLHQANKFIIELICKKMKLKKEQVPIVLDGYGNTGSASIPLVVSASDIDFTDKTVLMCGFGVGLSVASAITKIDSIVTINPFAYDR